jgi:hypothetical protein
MIQRLLFLIVKSYEVGLDGIRILKRNQKG